MSDDTTRTLERRYSATQDPSDLVALLSARLRDGSLSRERVELAAYLGHEAARNLVDFVVFNPHDADYAQRVELRWPGHLQVRDLHPIGEWARSLAAYGREACRRAAVAAAGAALYAYTPNDPECEAWTRAHEAVQAARAFALDPTPENHRRVCGLTHGDTMLVPDWVPCGCHMHYGGVFPLLAAASATSPEEVRAVCLEFVAPWALGLSDPLRDQARAARPDP